MTFDISWAMRRGAGDQAFRSLIAEGWAYARTGEAVD